MMDSVPRLDPNLLAAILRRRQRFAALLSRIARIPIEEAERVFRPLALEPGLEGSYP